MTGTTEPFLLSLRLRPDTAFPQIKKRVPPRFRLGRPTRPKPRRWTRQCVVKVRAINCTNSARLSDPDIATTGCGESRSGWPTCFSPERGKLLADMPADHSDVRTARPLGEGHRIGLSPTKTARSVLLVAAEAQPTLYEDRKSVV